MKDLSSDIDEAAKELAGNWKKFSSFGWHDEPEDGDNWGIVYTSNRDSGLLAESNEAAINAEMEKFDNDVRFERHGHWGCGYVDGFSIRVFDAKGNVTDAFKALHELAMALADYPVLDESDYSRREYKATLENIKSVTHNLIKDDVPEDYAEKIFSWMWDNNQRALEAEDDQGGYPSDDDMRECLEALGWLEKDEDDSD